MRSFVLFGIDRDAGERFITSEMVAGARPRNSARDVKLTGCSGSGAGKSSERAVFLRDMRGVSHKRPCDSKLIRRDFSSVIMAREQESSVDFPSDSRKGVGFMGSRE